VVYRYYKHISGDSKVHPNKPGHIKYQKPLIPKTIDHNLPDLYLRILPDEPFALPCNTLKYILLELEIYQ
jgi:hypothetical protein